MRHECTSREEWLKARRMRGIGASDAASIVNASPYKTASELWDEIVNGKEAKDISESEYVQRGIALEHPLRELFKASHPTYKITHHPYDMLYRAGEPWLFATLDGEIMKPDGTMGILEIKTCSPNGRAGWSKWDGRVPTHYYCQLLHQMLATGYDFAVLYAYLEGRDGNVSIREYEYSRDDCEIDMEWLLEQEKEFWNSCVERKIPKIRITL